ncbi:Protein phosphatase 1, partial [Globisporangium splendens]
MDTADEKTAHEVRTSAAGERARSAECAPTRMQNGRAGAATQARAHGGDRAERLMQFHAQDIGKRKDEAMASVLRKLNPDVAVCAAAISLQRPHDVLHALRGICHRTRDEKDGNSSNEGGSDEEDEGDSDESDESETDSEAPNEDSELETQEPAAPLSSTTAVPPLPAINRRNHRLSVVFLCIQHAELANALNEFCCSWGRFVANLRDYSQVASIMDEAVVVDGGGEANVQAYMEGLSRLDRVVDDSGYAFTALDVVASNQITDVAPLAELPHLVCVNLSDNALTAPVALPQQSYLQVLAARKQAHVGPSPQTTSALPDIAALLSVWNGDLLGLQIKTLEALSQLPQLSEVDLSGNPVVETPNYRLLLLLQVPSLRKLDSVAITEAERLAAVDLKEQMQQEQEQQEQEEQ